MIGGERFIKKELIIEKALGVGVVKKCRRPKEGDFYYKKNHIIEVKTGMTPKLDKKGKIKGKTLTCNQIRPRKYLPIVAYVGNKPYYGCDFIVLPANYVTAHFLDHKGQSTPNGMGSSAMGLSLKHAEVFGCYANNLEKRIDAAIEEADNDIFHKTISKYWDICLEDDHECNKIYKKEGMASFLKARQESLDKLKKMFNSL